MAPFDVSNPEGNDHPMEMIIVLTGPQHLSGGMGLGLLDHALSDWIRHKPKHLGFSQACPRESFCGTIG